MKNKFLSKKAVKKYIALGLVVSAMSTELIGCGNSDNSKKEEAQSAQQSSKETKTTKITYNYEQPLNIIDDNYRNYYEIFVYSFNDSNGDGIGDLKGIEQKLDYLKDMGINGIWLTPIMPSTTYHKYDVKDYCGIDPQYGTLEDFKSLVKEAHKRGINVITDMVFNHSSSQHKWFKEATDYLKGLKDNEKPDSSKCKYVDYYHFSTEQENDTYYQVPGTKYYYEGSFWSEMPDLNLSNKAVMNEINHISKFWMDMDVDGFRMDAIIHYSETDSKFNIETVKKIFDYCKKKDKDFYMVSEVWANESVIADYYGSKTPSMFNFDASSVEGCIEKTALGSFSAENLVGKMLEYQEKYAENNPDFIDAPFLTNHDQVRVANNLQGDLTKLKQAGGLLLMMNGSPFLYYGEEVGMGSTGQEDENKRLPMNWSKTDTTGMCEPATNADKSYEQTADPVDVQLKDDASLLNYYKRALRIRNENPEIARGKITQINSLTSGNQAAIIKEFNKSQVGIVYNTSEESITVDISGSELEGMNIRGYLTTEGDEVTMDNNKITIPARGICLLK